MVGAWYTTAFKKLCEISTINVLQNNYIIGNEAKIARAKSWGHWYLDSEENCIRRTAPVDSSSRKTTVSSDKHARSRYFHIEYHLLSETSGIVFVGLLFMDANYPVVL